MAAAAATQGGQVQRPLAQVLLQLHVQVVAVT
jgi:hypothetical protein